MELIRGLSGIQPHQRGCAATIGNFDGVHLGHAALIRSTIETARELNVRSCVITFEPLPMEYFATPENVPPRLTWLREKWRALSDFNLDQVMLLRFNKALATTAPKEFIDQLLVQGLGISHLLVGDDFRFGLRREGDANLLSEAGEQQGFSVRQAQTIELHKERVSSTRVRTLLKAGNLDTARQLLQRDYALAGRIMHGAKLGRTIGFPTANISMRGKNPPLRGVFAISATVPGLNNGASGIEMPGIANLGEKPTVDGSRLTLEVHLLDFNGDLYGKRMRVVFKHKLRPEKKFNSLDELKAAITNDESRARQWFAEYGNTVAL